MGKSWGLETWKYRGVYCVENLVSSVLEIHLIFYVDFE